MVVLAYRGASDPSEVAADHENRRSDQSPAFTQPVPSIAVPTAGVALTAAIGSEFRFSGGTPSLYDFQPSAAPSGWPALNPTGTSEFNVREIEFAAAGSLPANASWTWPARSALNRAREASAISVFIGRADTTIWSDPDGIPLAVGAGERVEYLAEAQRPFFEVFTPSVAAGDYTATGTVTVSAELQGVDALWVLQGGASGGAATLLQLRGQFLDSGGSVPVVRSDAASIGTYGRRPFAPRIWPYISQAEAQDLADAIVAYSAHPRASWDVVLDADRDAATAAACLETEIGQPVRTNIDAEFNRDGRVLAIANRSSGPATLLETTLTLLDAETVQPQPFRLYLDNVDNPLFLDRTRWSCANPLSACGHFPQRGQKVRPPPA